MLTKGVVAGDDNSAGVSNIFHMQRMLIAIKTPGGDCQPGRRCDFGLHCRGPSNASSLLDKVRQCQSEVDPFCP